MSGLVGDIERVPSPQDCLSRAPSSCCKVWNDIFAGEKNTDGYLGWGRVLRGHSLKCIGSIFAKRRGKVLQGRGKSKSQQKCDLCVHEVWDKNESIEVETNCCCSG